MGGVTEYNFDGAIVRIHEGKLTPEERRANIEAAAKDFMRRVMKERQAKEQQRREERVQNG